MKLNLQQFKHFKLFQIRTFTLYLNFWGPRFLVGLSMAVVSFLLCWSMSAPRLLSVLMCGAFAALGTIQIQCSPTLSKWLNSLWLAIASWVILCMSQHLLEMEVLSLGALRIFLGILCCGVVLFFLFICTMHFRATVIAGTSILMLLTIANYFVGNFRGNELAPADFLALGTAMGVAGQYDYSVNVQFLFVCMFCVHYCFFGFCFPQYKLRHTVKRLLMGGAAEAILLLALVLGIQNITPQFFLQEGALINGYLLNFTSRIRSTSVKKPDGYSASAIEDLEKQYATDGNENANGKKPDIIMIMNEAFVDLRVIGDLKTDVPVMPFYDSLTENTIRGYALASVFGGGTCNSEYEALTGNTMAFLPDRAYPYQQYIQKNSWSLAKHLSDIGYTAVATHPEKGANWMRTTVYPDLGFEKSYFIEEYPQKDLLRGHVSDKEMYQWIVERYEEKPEDEKLFLLGITMQNHSGYDYAGEDFINEVNLEGYSAAYPDVEQYLTLLRHSDRALEYLIHYFQTVENDVVVVFFGDHFPRIDSKFYEELNGSAFDTLEEKLLQYQVPFFVWTNYDIPEETVDCTSLNYLSTYLYRAAGLEMPPYVRFLEEMKAQIPAINPFGYYSKEKQRFVELDAAISMRVPMILDYQILQYNCIFDKKNRSQLFFS